jgi:D-amino-acid oxidase
LVSNPCDRTITQQYADGSWTYIIPRPSNGGTILGGTKQKGDWNPHADIDTRRKILSRCAEVFPPIITNGLPPDRGGFNVICDIVGRRPARHGGPRIEREIVGDKKIIHAYGFGGIGFAVSWGVVSKVLDLLDEVTARL